jgi:hypothetical protein
VGPEEFVTKWKADGHQAEAILPSDVRVVLKSGWTLRFSTNVTKDPRLWSLVEIHHRSTAETGAAKLLLDAAVEELVNRLA